MTDAASARDDLDVQRTLHDYAWACDDGDWALLPTVFTADARLDYSSTGGPVGGRDEVCAWLEASLTQVEMIQHVVTNFRVDVDGDEAAGRAMFLCIFRLPGMEGVLQTGGYYELAFRRIPADGWKISRLYEDNRWRA